MARLESGALAVYVVTSSGLAPGRGHREVAVAALEGGATARPITVAVLARQPVEVRIVADDAPPETFHLEVGEGRSFDGDRSVSIRLSEGGTAQITVNGSDEGFPGATGRPWRRTYSYASPSPAP